MTEKWQPKTKRFKGEAKVGVKLEVVNQQPNAKLEAQSHRQI